MLGATCVRYEDVTDARNPSASQRSGGSIDPPNAPAAIASAVGHLTRKGLGAGERKRQHYLSCDGTEPLLLTAGKGSKVSNAI